MPIEEFKVRLRCPECGSDGRLVIMKDLANWELIVACNKCHQQWPSPEEAINSKPCLQKRRISLSIAGPKDIKGAHWEKFVVEPMSFDWEAVGKKHKLPMYAFFPEIMPAVLLVILGPFFGFEIMHDGYPMQGIGLIFLSISGGAGLYWLIVNGPRWLLWPLIIGILGIFLVLHNALPQVELKKLGWDN